MKKIIVSVCLVLSLLLFFVSCDGAVGDKLFYKDHVHDYSVVLEDGTWACSHKNCVKTLAKTEEPYFALVEDGHVSEIVSLNDDYKSDEIKGLFFTDDYINYESDKKVDVYLRTKASQTVFINAAKSTVHHYNKADVVVINAVAKESYHLNGSVNDLVVRKGNIVLEENASVNDFAVAKEATGSDITIVKEDTATIGTLAIYSGQGNSGSAVKINDNDILTQSAKELVGNGTDSIVEITDNNTQLYRVENVLYGDLVAAKTAAGTDKAVRIINDTNFSGSVAEDEVLKVSVDVKVTIPSESNLDVESEGTLEVYGKVTNKNTLTNGGSIKNYGNILSTKEEGSAELTNNADIENYGSINAENGAKITSSGQGSKIENYGTVEASGKYSEIQIKGSSSVENYGTINVGDEVTLTIESGSSLSNKTEGVISNDGIITNNGTVDDKGTINTSAQGQITGDGFNEDSSIYVAQIGEAKYTSFAKVVEYLEEQTSGTITVDILRDVTVDSNFYADELKQVEVVINGNDYSYVNSYQYQGNEEEDKHNLSGVLFGSSDYEQYRPVVTINNWNVTSQWEAFYATDTVDITLNNCKGETKLTQTGKAVETFNESVLACSFNAKLVVNGGEYKSSNYGAQIYSTGGKIELNNCSMEAPYVIYVCSPSSNASVSDSKVSVSGGKYNGELYEDSKAGYLTYVAKLEITGGTFDHDPSSYLDDDYMAKKNSGTPETWTVVKAPDQVEVSDGNTTTKMPLAKFRNSVNKGDSYEGKTVKLLCDVDLSDTEWTPIGTETYPFNGIFDGAGYTVKNMKVTAQGTYGSGFFGYVQGSSVSTFSQTQLFNGSEFNSGVIKESDYDCVIKNLTIDNAKILLGSGNVRHVSACVGSAKKAYIKNIKVTGNTVINVYKYGAGIVALTDDVVIEKCSVGDKVKLQGADTDTKTDGGGHIAGIVAYDNGTPLAVISCVNSASIENAKYGYNGGILAYAGGNGNNGAKAIIYDCTNNGSIATCGSSQYVGGIVGNGQGSPYVLFCTNNGTITGEAKYSISGIGSYFCGKLYSCINYGNITGNAQYIGGLIGQTYQSTLEIENSANHGTLSNSKVDGVTNNYVASSTHGTTIENQSFANVQALEEAVSGVAGTLILKNLTVTDKSGTLHLPSSVFDLISDVGYFAGLDISGCSRDYITVSIPNFEYSLHGDAAAKTLGLSGVNNKTTFASDCKLDWLRNYGSNGTYVKETGCVVNLIHGASKAN